MKQAVLCQAIQYLRQHLTALLVLLLSGSTVLAAPLTVSWRNKPPYHYMENGEERGFLLERSRLVFALAGIEAEFVQMPTLRIWQSFNARQSNLCSIGWYRLPERENLVQYSAALHTDPPQLVIAAPSAQAAVRAHASLASLLQDKNLLLGLAEGVSYGSELDALLTRATLKIERRNAEPLALLRMLALDRFSIMLADREDWNYLRRNESGLDKLGVFEFADMPRGLQRHIVCSKDVSPLVMEKINRAISQLPRY